MHVKTVMKTPPTIVGPFTLLHDAAARLAVDRARCALVVRQGRLEGILTEADVHRARPSTIARLAHHDLAEGVRRLDVAAAMRPAGGAVAPDAPIRAAARLMRERRASALAVVDGDEPVGVLTAAILLPLVIAGLDGGGRRGVERVVVVVDADADTLLVDMAVRLAPAGVEVVHVLPALIRLRHAGAIPAWARDEISAVRQRHAYEWLAGLLARVNGAPAGVRVLDGEPTEAIRRTARDGVADLIVLRRDHRHLAPLMRIAPCPVLAL